MEVQQHPRFKKFFAEVKDVPTRARILLSITKLESGNPGKAKSVGGGVWELKIDYGPGWRLYYTQVGKQIVMLLTGGTKNEQQKDIDAAKKLAEEIQR